MRQIRIRQCNKDNMINFILMIAEGLLCLLIIKYSGIEFQRFTKLAMLTLSVIPFIMTFRGWILWTERVSVKNITLDIVMCFYMGFALVGQRLLVYPLNKTVSAKELLVFMCAVAWSYPLLKFVCKLIDNLSTSDCLFGHAKQMRNWKFILCVDFLLLIPVIVNLIANNPANTSPDSYATMVTNAHSIRGMYDWHSAYYCMILALLQKISDTTYIVIFTQWIIYLVVFTDLFLWMRSSLGGSDRLLIVISLLIGINPAMMLHLNTIWKDIPYFLFLMEANICIAKMLFNAEQYKYKPYVYIMLGISLINIYLVRKNGIVPFIFIIIAALLINIKNKWVWSTIIGSFIVIAVIKGPIYSYYEIEDPGQKGMFIGLGQDILGVYYADGNITEDTYELIEVMTDYDVDNFDYNPTYARQSYDLYVPVKRFLGDYIQTFIDNPVIMTRAVLAREDLLWDVFEGANVEIQGTDYKYAIDGWWDWNDYYPPRNVNGILGILNEKMSLYTAKSNAIQLSNVVIWRTGLWVVLWMIIVHMAIKKRMIKKIVIVSLPVIGQILGLLLSTGWSDFRYFMPVNLLVIVIFAFMLLKTRQKKGIVISNGEVR